MIYQVRCDELVFDGPQREEGCIVLDSSNIGAHADVAEGLKRMGGEVSEYLQDVHAGRVVALVMLRDGKVMHYSYVFLRNKSACILGLSDDTALIGNAFTVPEYRGRGCQPRSIALRAAIAKERGYRFIAAETSPENRASQRGMHKGGMSFIGRLGLVVILNCLIIRWHRPPGIPMFGFCLRA